MNLEKNLFSVKQINETDILENETIGELALRTGLYIDQPCGGKGLCGKCKVIVEDVVPEPTEREKRILSETELSSGIRLACQTKALPGMSIRFPDQKSDQIQVLETFSECTSSVKPSSLPTDPVGIAIDIGTTTIVVYVVDIERRKQLSVISGINPQVAYGADVISRISHVENKRNGLEELQKCLIKQINQLIRDVLDRIGTLRTEVACVVVAANSTMEHIFAGISPSNIGRAPFEPQFYESLEFRASEIGIEVDGDTVVKLMPNISGFVGGDIIAGMLYCEMLRSDALSLLVDIGTNNEMVLGNRELSICCSAAAGPALEGAKISMGMRAAPGAIDRVEIIDGEVQVRIIGGISPVGICGSGLVDAVAELIRTGVITRSGRFAKSEDIVDKKLAARLKGSRGKGSYFVLVEASEDGKDPQVVLTQKDIREVQLAKGAIATGVHLLLETSGKKLEDIKRVFVAGAFGNYIDIENAVKISILPNVLTDRICPIGNSSGLGACMMLNDPGLWTKAEELRKKTKHIELANHKDFQDIFISNLPLGEIAIKEQPEEKKQALSDVRIL